MTYDETFNYFLSQDDIDEEADIEDIPKEDIESEDEEPKDDDEEWKDIE